MLFVGTSIIHPSTEGVFLLCNILDLLIYSFQQKSKGQNEMHNKLAVTLLTLAGICFVSGMALLLS